MTRSAAMLLTLLVLAVTLAMVAAAGTALHEVFLSLGHLFTGGAA